MIGILHPIFKKTRLGMMRKLKVTSGLLQENSFMVITSFPESNCTCREKNHFLSTEVHRRYQNNMYITQANVGKKKNRLKITGTWMEKKNCLMHGQASQDLFC